MHYLVIVTAHVSQKYTGDEKCEHEKIQLVPETGEMVYDFETQRFGLSH